MPASPSLLHRFFLPEGKGVRWVIGVYLLVTFLGLTVYPLVFEDEVTLDEPAKELALHGRWRSEFFMHAKAAEQFDRFFFWQPPGQGLVVAASYRIFGYGVWQTRLPGVLAAAGCIALIAALARRAGGAGAATVAALLLACHPQFFRTSTNARMDTYCWCLLLGAWLVLLYAEERERRAALRLSALAGLLVGLAAMMHVLAISWAIGLNLVLVVRRAGWQNWLAFNLACAAAPVAWLAWAWPHFDLWTLQFLTHGAGRTAVGGLGTRIIDELARNWIPNRPAPLYLVALVGGLILALRWRLRNTVLGQSALIGGAAVIFVTLLMGKGSGEYNGYFILPIIVVSAAGLVELTRRAPGRRRLILAVASVAIAWSVVRLAGPVFVARFYQGEARDYSRVAAEITPFLRAGDGVWGVPEAWYAVTQAGARLHSPVGSPNPAIDRVVIIPADCGYPVPPSYERVGRVGRPLPRIAGRTLSSNDYQLEIWTARAARVP